jgi:hypothetical protein
MAQMDRLTEMRPKQERRPTVRKAHDPRGARPRMGRVRSIGNVEIPQEAFLAILKVDG